MKNLFAPFSKHKNQALLIVFLMIALPPIGLYYLADSKPASMALLGIVVVGNILAMSIQ